MVVRGIKQASSNMQQTNQDSKKNDRQSREAAVDKRDSDQEGYATADSKENYETREEGMRVLRSIVKQEAAANETS